MHRPRRLAFAALLLLLVTSPARAEHRIGGKAASEAFPDARLATLASTACKGDVKGVAALVQSGVDPDGTGLEGVVPLFWVIHCGNLAGIEALLRAGANPNYRIPGRFSLVYQAATYRDDRILRLLLKYGGDPNTTSTGDNQGTSAAWEAISLASVAGWRNFDALIDAGLDINRPDAAGNTVAVDLIALGHFDKMLELLSRGYNYDLVDLGGVVTIRKTETRKQAADKARLQAELERRGVKFPVPSRFERERAAAH